MNQKIKVGLVGAGSRCSLCFGKILKERSDVSIVAICDINSVRAQSMAAHLGCQKTYGDINELLDKEVLDAVIITTPDHLHAEHAVAAMKKDVNVLIDKPLATNVISCRRIIDAAEASGKIAMMGFNLRYHAVLRKLKNLIENGVLGRIFLLENREFHAGGKTYMARWNRKYELCGGLWVHKGSHDFDIFNWLLDFPIPQKVVSFAGIDVFNSENFPFMLQDGIVPGPQCSKCSYAELCPDCTTYRQEEWGDAAQREDGYIKDLCIYTSDKDVHDNGIAIVEYENGVKASHMECFVSSRSDRSYTIVGTQGYVSASLSEMRIRFFPRWSQEVITYDLPPEDGGHGGADPGLVDAFLEIIKNQGENMATVKQGLIATAIGQAAEISRREERVVYLRDIL